MDLIDREQAIATIDNLNAISFYEANEHSREAYKEIRMAIEQLPSAEKTGRWETVDKGHYFYDWKCSVCGGSGRGDYLFCPNCGARMETDNE